MISAKNKAIINDHRAASIQHKSLVVEQLEMIYVQKWFNIWVPRSYGGLELSLMEGFELLEELAYLDGGLGWTVTLCSGANMFAGYLDPEQAKAIFSERNVCWGGSGRVGGIADLRQGMYEISGEWQYATGAPHLTHFTLNCFIHEDGVPQLDDEQNPVVRSFFVDRDSVLIHYDWDTIGLECTASHSFSIAKLMVPVSNSFTISPAHRLSSGHLYNYPFLPFAEITLLANYAGMYRRFLDLMEKYFFEKSRSDTWADKYAKNRFKLIDRKRTYLEHEMHIVRELIAESWENVIEDFVLNEHIFEQIHLKSHAIVREIRSRVVELYPLAGIYAAQRDSELNIVFRNLFTASQHSLLNIED
ncbi:acyl-CoA dehydrogenase [Sphingobacterium alkalisoli]|uniref:Acyl-CoA dehydrogenase n=1 Tax=Sphingobacterium alkalisoli TaxID=1874115 RepID=A0A4U0H2X1_9SPHI|nr:acyl-CoA dehydrogenase [Sphingobacterium alkalisoli]TJY65985.1 acyl-CoA dehydrogenase [Sphingobacterium alkalisoli]GGH17029.1 hydroxylase [Sphingobacterium alkalisoli]